MNQPDLPKEIYSHAQHNEIGYSLSGISGKVLCCQPKVYAFQTANAKNWPGWFGGVLIAKSNHLIELDCRLGGRRGSHLVHGLHVC